MTKTKTLGIVIIVLFLLTTPALAFNLNSFNTNQFTQPDTIIQDYYNPQNLNRYSYVLNNPYKYTDPDGHSAILAVGLGLSYLVSMTSPYWAPYIGAYFTDQNVNDVQSAVNDPSLGNVAWGVLGAWDLATPGIPESGAVKKGASFTNKLTFKNTFDVQMFKIDELWGTHKVDNPYYKLSQRHPKGIHNDPLEIWQVKDKLIVSDGMGRSIRKYLEDGTEIEGKLMNPDEGSNYVEYSKYAKSLYPEAKYKIVDQAKKIK